MSRLFLAPDRVEELASRPGARRAAVENFLSSLGEDRHEAYENMRADARSYRWSEATVGAICEGISEAETRGGGRP